MIECPTASSCAVAVQPLGALVPGADGAIEVLAEDGVRGILDDGGKPANDRVGRLLALRDVHEGKHDPFDAIVQGAVGHDAARPPAAVGGRDFLFPGLSRSLQHLLGVAEQVRVAETGRDVAERPAEVRGDEIETAGWRRA